MRNLIRRAAVAASAAVVLLGAAAGVASASGGPVLGWSPTTSTSAYNYGTVTAGQRVSEVFTLANSGGAGTGALAITLTGSSAFTKTADTCTAASLGPKKSCTVTVTYAPTTPGQTDKATLTGTSKKPAATATLTLQGAAAKASPALATAPAAGGTVGAAVTDTATLSGGFSPGGTIEFKLYGPSTTADCSGTPLDDETVTVTGNGSYTTPGGFIPAKAGTYWWTASYTGDPSNNPVASGCDQESVTISPVTPVIATTPSAGPLGGKGEVTDTATLSGGYHPTGTIEFKLYGPSTTADCSGTPLDDETVTVTGNGSYGTPAGYTATQAGTYWWTASYSGDPGNNPATAGCGTESITVSPVTPAITTTANPANATVGTVATDTATLTGGYNPTGTIQFVPYGPFPPGAAPDCSSTILPEVGVVAVNGNGSYTSPSLIFNQPGTYYWVASYTGDTNNNPTSTGCGDEPVVISPASPALATSPSPGVPVGTAVTDTATLANGYNPAGTITFNLYGPSPTADCSTTPVFTDTENVGGAAATSASFTPTQAGTYWWTASSSGDPNNNPAATNCGDEPVTIGPHLYWTNFAFGGSIDEANLDGTGVTTLVTGQDGPFGVAVDSSHIYWTNYFDGTIDEANLDGTGVTTLVTGQSNPTGVAVDSSHIYWTNDGNGTVNEANLDGTGVTTLVTSQSNPAGVAVDSSHIYWGNLSNGTIMEANLNGTGVTTLVTGQDGPTGVAVDSSHIYWANESVGPNGTIDEANLNGTGVTTLVTGQGLPFGVAVDSSHIYWANKGNSKIMEANLDGAAVTTLVSGLNGPVGVAVGP